jgi:hypothetical protein
MKTSAATSTTTTTTITTIKPVDIGTSVWCRALGLHGAVRRARVPWTD